MNLRFALISAVASCLATDAARPVYNNAPNPTGKALPRNEEHRVPAAFSPRNIQTFRVTPSNLNTYARGTNKTQECARRVRQMARRAGAGE